MTKNVLFLIFLYLHMLVMYTEGYAVMHFKQLALEM